MFDPGARRVALLLGFALVGVLAYAAFWRGDRPEIETATVITQAPARSAPTTRERVDRIFQSLIAGRQNELQSCITDVAGTPPPGRRRIAPNVRDLVAILSRQLESLRGLRFRQRVDPKLLPAGKLDRRLAELNRKEERPRLERAATRILVALGAIPAGDDIGKLERDALKGQVAGFYVPESGELLVASEEKVGIPEIITLVHELEHALADQRFDLDKRDQPTAGAADSQSAYQALVEGDATLSQFAYLLRFGSAQDLLDAFDAPGSEIKAERALLRYPAFVQRELFFPYIEGLLFDCARYQKGGWKAVDHAYRHPPASTAELMFPERYAGPAPKRPGPFAAPGKPWKRSITTTVGASDLASLFAAPGGNLEAALADSRRLAGRWAGGRARLWTDGPRTALAVALVDRGRAGALCDAIHDWRSAAFGDRSTRQSYSIRCHGNVVRLGIAPNPRVSRRLARASARAR